MAKGTSSNGNDQRPTPWHGADAWHKGAATVLQLDATRQTQKAQRVALRQLHDRYYASQLAG